MISTMTEYGERPKELARRIQSRVRGWSVKRIYELLLEIGARSE